MMLLRLLDARHRPHRRAPGDRAAHAPRCSTRASPRSSTSTARSAARATSRRSPHCALALMGEGDVRDATGALCRPAERSPRPASTPVELAEKEGLALINGTDGMLGMLVLALADLRRAAHGRRHHRRDERRGAARHGPRCSPPTCTPCARSPGQARVGRQHARAAGRLRDRRQPPRARTCTRVQDAYSLRCAPQVARRRPRHPRPRRDGRRPRAGLRHRQPGGARPTAGSSPTATSTARRSPTCSTSSRSSPPTSPRSPSGAPTGSSTRPATTACRRSSPTTRASTRGHMIAQYTQAAIVSRDEAARGPGQRRLDPELGDAGGPRLDGLVGRAQAAPRGRRADPRAGGRAAHRRPRHRAARAARAGARDRRRHRGAAGRGRRRARARTASSRPRSTPRCASSPTAGPARRPSRSPRSCSRPFVTAPLGRSTSGEPLRGRRTCDA